MTQEQRNVIDKILNLLEEQSKNKKDLCSYLNVSATNFGNWISGRNVSFMKYIHAIADYFGVSVNYLLGKETQKENAPGEMILTESENMLLELFRSLPPDKQELVAQTVKAFADSQK